MKIKGHDDSSRTEVLPGTEFADTIEGFAGRDFINGGDGIDKIYGGKGNDHLLGEGGDDHVFGGDGNDYISGAEGNDHLYGNDGGDTLSGGQGTDWLEGDAGNDRLSGGTATDHLFGGSGNDELSGGNDVSRDFMTGGSGRDRFEFDMKELAGNRIDVITDFSSSDTIFADVSGIGGGYREIAIAHNGGYDKALQKAATMIDSTHMYAFVTDGVDGYLFADADDNGFVDSAMKLEGLTSVTQFSNTDIVHLI